MGDNILEDKNILHELEKKIHSTRRTNLKKSMTEAYIKLLIELASIEEKEYSYYNEKLDKLDISSNKKEQVLKEIKLKSISKQILDEERMLYNKLKEDFKNPNNLLVETWMGNYKAFLEKYKNELYGFYNDYTIAKYIKEFDVLGNYKYITKELRSNVPKTNTIETIEIKSIKGPYSNRKENDKRIDSLLNKIRFIPSDITAYMIYLICSNRTLNNPNILLFLIKNGYRIDESGHLIKKDGRVVNKQFINREKTNYIKNLLLKNKPDGEIPYKYKDNRLKTLLMDMYVVRKRNSKLDIKESGSNGNIDIYKGMGKC